MKSVNHLGVGLWVVVLVAVVRCGAVDWSSLTNDTLAALPPADFVNATKSNIAAIPEDACSGFQYLQVSNLSLSGVSGLSSGCISQVHPSAFAGFSSAQVSAFPSDFNGACSGVSSDQIRSLPASSIPGLQPPCVLKFTTACAGFTLAQVPLLPSPSVAQIQSDCMQAIPAASFPGFTPSQVSSFSSSFGAGCLGLTSNQTALLAPSSFSGFTPSCLGKLTSACGGFPAAGVSHLNLSSVPSISSECMGAIPALSFPGFSPAQVAQFSSSFGGGCFGLTPAQLTNMPSEATSGFTPTCLGKLTSACAGFTPSGLSGLSPSSASGISSECIGAIPAPSFAGFTQQQVGNFSSSFGMACSGLNGNQTAYLTNSAVSGFTLSCFSKLQSACSGFTKSAISSLPLSALSGISSECMGVIQPLSFAGFSKEQVEVFPSGFGVGCEGIVSSQLEMMNPLSAAGFSKACLGTLTTACSGFTKESVENLVNSSVVGISEECMQNLPPAAFGGFSMDQVASFSSSFSGGCYGVTSSQMEILSPTIYGGFQAACMSKFEEACVGFTKEGVSNINLLAITNGISSDCTMNIPADSFAGFTIHQITAFSYKFAGICGAISVDQMKALSQQQVQAFTPLCIGVWDSSIFNNVSSIIPYLSLSQVTGISSYQIESLTNSAMLTFSLPQLENLDRNIFHSFSGYQLAILSSHHKRAYVTLFNQTLANYFSLQNAYDLKLFFLNGTTSPFLTKNDTVFSELESVQWLEVCFLEDSDFGTLMSQTTIPQLKPRSLIGIRANQVKVLAPKAFSSISSQQSWYLLPDTLHAMNGEQYSNLSVAAFLNITVQYLKYIPLAAIPSLTLDQLRNVTCDMLDYFTASQYAAFTPAQNQTLHSVMEFCTHPPSPPSPSPDMNIYIYAGVGGGAGLVLLIIIAVCVYRSKRTKYTPLT